MKGYVLIDGNKIGYRSNGLFPKRAILRIGLLLRKSEVAKEVRPQLLMAIEKNFGTLDNAMKELAQ